MRLKLKFVTFLSVGLFCGTIASKAQITQLNGVELTPEQQKAIQTAIDLNMMNASDLEDMQHTSEETIFIPRPKDQQRIQAIPDVALEQTAMLQYVAKLSKALEATIEETYLAELRQMMRQTKPQEINQVALLAWYQQADQEAALLAMKAVQTMPDSAMAWNNLGGLLNMMHMEELAIPILKYGQRKESNNPSILNNLGQSFLGLGDVLRAEEYFGACLAQDTDHPEATRSMGVVALTKGDQEKASQYFEQDLRENLRESSFEWLKRAKGRQDIKLNTLRKAFLQRKKQGDKNFYGMVALGQLGLPTLPLTSEQTEKWLFEKEQYVQSITEEAQYWYNEFQTYTAEEVQFAVHKTEPYYSWLVTEVIHELTSVHSSEDIAALDAFWSGATARMVDYEDRRAAMSCPDPPEGASEEVRKAYDKKCCEIAKGIIDPFMSAHNEDLRRNFEFRDGMWKLFLNELISTVELCPTPDNKKQVYLQLYHYANFLISYVGMVVAEDTPCDDDMTLAEMEAILKRSKRKVELKCPSWLYYELPFPGVGSITMSCAEFQVEAKPLSIVKAGYKKTFKDQTSTLYVGVGPSMDVGPLVNVSAGVQGYLVFDRHEQLVNTGISAEAKMSLPQGIADLVATAKVEMNSGYSHEVKSDSRWVQQIKSTYSKY